MIKIYNMDVLKALKSMPDESVDMQITSPPYWGLRDYGDTGIIWGGDEDCEHEFKEIRTKRPNASGGKTEYAKQKLAIKGVGNYSEFTDYSDRATYSQFCLKCNAWKGQLGLEPTFDLYVKHLCDIFDEVKRVLRKDGTCWINLGDTYSGGGGGNYGNGISVKVGKEKHLTNVRNRKKFIEQIGVQAKCLCAIPERFMIEMINRGWILRNKIIWHKPNHMPTSVKDRFATSWEYLFFFSKSKKYYFDLDAVREKHKNTSLNRSKAKAPMSSYGTDKIKNIRNSRQIYGNQNMKLNPKGKCPDDIITYNKYMGISPTGLHSGNDYHPLGKNPSDFWEITTQGYSGAHFAVFPEALVKKPIKTTRKNAIILDIFAGSGTTLKVARNLDRDSIGIEIKKEYVDLIKKRLMYDKKGNRNLYPEPEIIR